jgi:Fic family protein
VFQQILTLRTEVEQMILGLGKRAPSARLALNLLYRKPIINAIDIEKGLEISTPTANALIKALIDLGVIVEITGQQRWRSYAFKRYLKLFLS